MKQPFYSFDTETQNGEAFLACTYNGETYSDYLINNKRDVIAFIIDFHASTNKGFCFNLDYDASALLKYFGQQAIIQLYLGKTIFINTEENGKEKQQEIEFSDEPDNPRFHSKNISPNIISVRYIPAKCLQVTYKRKTLYVWDIWQYYQMSLAKASSEYLKERKRDLPKPWMREMKKHFLNKHRKNRILKYCRHDSKLTWLLSQKFLNMLEDGGIKVRRYYSAGYIAKKHIKAKVDIPYITDEEVIKFLKPVYFGGRIEVTRRGYFKKAYLYDINSAYPYALSKLKSFYDYRFSSRIDYNSDYFFVDCEIELKKDYILPVPISFNVWKYPYGKMRCTIDNRTFKNVLDAGGKILVIHKCLNIYCENIYPFKKTVESLFKERQKSESHKYIFKMLLNAYTGKLHEKKKTITHISEEKQYKLISQLHQYNKAQADFETDVKSTGCNCYYIGKVSKSCKNPVCIEYRREYKGITKPPDIYYLGKNMFTNEKHLANGTNIIYAALVTSTIRNMVYEKGMELGNNLIGFLTDGILSKTPLKSIGKGLGEFSKKYEGWLYSVGSGIYQTANGTKFRGFNSSNDLIKLAQKFKNSDVMEIPYLERVGLGRAVGSLQKFNQFNQLIADEKDLNINFDRNRIWPSQFKNYGQALKSNINSEPIEIK